MGEVQQPIKSFDLGTEMSLNVWAEHSSEAEISLDYAHDRENPRTWYIGDSDPDCVQGIRMAAMWLLQQADKYEQDQREWKEEF